MNQIWLEVSIDTRSAALEALAAYLTACGIVGLVLEDENDLAQFEDENRSVWSEVDESVRDALRGVSRVKFYLPDGEDGRARLAEITAGLEGFRARTEADAGTLAVHVASLQEEDWAHNWQQYYQPFPVGERLYVVPEWLRDAPVPEGRTALYLNPGLIFGTGSHSTTQLCLEGLEACVRPGDRVLDLGCGSGILSIAALRLGAATAVGCDIDPKAARVAAENAAYNGIGEEFRVYTGDIVNDAELRERLAGRYEIVLANIIADVIIPLAPVVPAFLAPGGRFLCSGIIEHRAGDVADALRAAGWTILEERRREGWVSLLAGMAGELG
ncbi:MAG TPA: 50S ribosomal protein L11 methyltransferase [Candidatus Onthomonas avicola]|nr:50S ribosomal protein L11 methyltransferase [Candidatus Onthomonas avicola]